MEVSKSGWITETKRTVRIAVNRHSGGGLFLSMSKSKDDGGARFAGHNDGFGGTEINAFNVDVDRLAELLNQYAVTKEQRIFSDAWPDGTVLDAAQ